MYTYIIIDNPNASFKLYWGECQSCHADDPKLRECKVIYLNTTSERINYKTQPTTPTHKSRNAEKKILHRNPMNKFNKQIEGKIICGN